MDNLVDDIKIAIDELKKEITLKQDELDELIEEYQKVNEITPEC